VTRFSIVVPHLNSGPALARGLASILGQTGVDVQIIVVDGGSTDESRDTLERHREDIDVLIVEPDRGYADALNKGFARADGDIFGWLPADDELLPNALASVALVFAADHDCDMVTGACERVFEDGTRLIRPPDPRAWEKIHIQNVIEQTATFWRRELHRRVAPLDHERFPYIADWDLWVRMRDAGARLRTTDRLLSRYHFTAHNQTSRAGRRFADEAFTLLRLRGPLGGLLAYAQSRMAGRGGRRDNRLLISLTAFVGRHAAERGLGRYIPFVGAPVNAIANEVDTRRLADRAILFYGG